MPNTRKKSNKKNQWLIRQERDPFVKMAKEKGYKSRAAFKLLEIHKKYKLLNNVNSVCDIGAAPGGWCQVISEFFSKQSTDNSKRITAIDLLSMDPIPYVTFIQGDFTKPETINQISEKAFDLVVSDMAPNTSGHQETDHLRSMSLSNDVLNFVKSHLKTSGNMAIKIFMGSKEKNFIAAAKEIFNKVEYMKPDSSRSESKEIYVICLDKKIT